MLSRFSVIGKIGVSLPAEKVLAVVWDLNNVALYEPKVDAVQIEPEAGKKGTYSVEGHFGGIPWGGVFSYDLNGRGFHSEMIQGPSGVRFNGGFVVAPERQDQSTITHYERYQFPPWLSPLVPIIRLYLVWAMRKELRNLAKVIYEKFRPGTRVTTAMPVPVVSRAA